MKRYLVFGVLASLPVFGAPSATREVPFSGSEVFAGLGIPAWKCELTLPRAAKRVTATIILGHADGLTQVEEEIQPGSGFAPATPVTRFTTGLIYLADKKLFRVLLVDMTSTLEAPVDFRFEYSSYSPRGMLAGDTVIFAFEPKDRQKGARTKDEMARWLGIRYKVVE
jgi:hypothetical protein